MSALRRLNSQTATYPDVLAGLVGDLTYRPGWRFRLASDFPRDQDPESGEVTGRGLTFIVTTVGYDSYHPDRGQTYRVNHFFPVPPATYDVRSWRRWLLDRLLEVERHEACEFFAIAGQRPYAPSHGPGNDPYLIREVGTDLDVRIRFTGEVSL